MNQLGIMQHIRLDYVCIFTTCLTVRGTFSHVENSSINRPPSLCTCYFGPHQPPATDLHNRTLQGEEGDGCTCAHEHHSLIPVWSQFLFISMGTHEKFSEIWAQDTLRFSWTHSHRACSVNRISKALRSRAKDPIHFRVWAHISVKGSTTTQSFSVQLQEKKHLTPEPKPQSPLECAGRMWGYSGHLKETFVSHQNPESYLACIGQQQSNWSYELRRGMHRTTDLR